MATIHITEIQKYLAVQGEVDALPHKNNKEGYFLEWRFDDPNRKRSVSVDREYRNKIIIVDCPYGMVTISFDDHGQLESLDIS